MERHFSHFFPRLAWQSPQFGKEPKSNVELFQKPYLNSFVQLKQRRDPLEDQVPMLQPRHDTMLKAPFTDDQVPGAQFTQFENEFVPLAEDQVPAGQFWQESFPVPGLDVDQVPALHKVQTETDVAPVADDQVPIGQKTQLRAPRTDDQVPAAQSTQFAMDEAFEVLV
jgi:hypothetical protein